MPFGPKRVEADDIYERFEEAWRYIQHDYKKIGSALMDGKRSDYKAALDQTKLTVEKYMPVVMECLDKLRELGVFPTDYPYATSRDPWKGWTE